ncbi:unnamed protein product [Cylicocyclus nassatus]|uniref:Uncharacterized protein n=1 Tax=Cylicocyclus nassatus TaxID=53992 RepID=A0AA36H7I6_CYLNA|nr:unnamed protein product [Cylicocyclus nassatus]
MQLHLEKLLSMSSSKHCTPCSSLRTDANLSWLLPMMASIEFKLIKSFFSSYFLRLLVQSSLITSLSSLLFDTKHMSSLRSFPTHRLQFPNLLLLVRIILCLILNTEVLFKSSLLPHQFMCYLRDDVLPLLNNRNFAVSSHMPDASGGKKLEQRGGHVERGGDNGEIKSGN